MIIQRILKTALSELSDCREVWCVAEDRDNVRYAGCDFAKVPNELRSRKGKRIFKAS